MPNFSDRFPVSMKKIILFISFIVLTSAAIPCFAQQGWNASGVWTGTLFNDTTKKFIPIEIAISYQNSRYSGYTYTVFVIDSIENIGIKEVTIKERDDQFIIRDKKLIDDNYTEPPAKGVYTTLELEHHETDTTDILSGSWFTNKTKEYYALTGTVSVSRRKNIFTTRIIPKLRSLGLADQLSFYEHQRNLDIAARKKLKEQKPAPENDSMMTIVEQPLVITFPKKQTPEIQLNNKQKLEKLLDSVQKNDTKNIAINNPGSNNPSNIQSQIKEENKSPVTVSPKENSKINSPANQEQKPIQRNEQENEKPKNEEKEKQQIAQSQINQESKIANPVLSKKDQKNFSTENQKQKQASEDGSKNEKQQAAQLQIEQKNNASSPVSIKEDSKNLLTENQRKEHISEMGLKKENPQREESGNHTEVANKKQESNPVILPRPEVKTISQNPTETRKADNAKEKSEPAIAEKSPQPEKLITTTVEKETVVANKIDFSDRKIQTIRTVAIAGDSLVLSLFDNGTVDGDTVSVILNGNVIMPKVGLLATAINKTIHLTPEMGDSIKIILYAENLGSIPPNTGLLVVRNGGHDYEIRFSGDLKNNSAIILLRNKEE